MVLILITILTLSGDPCQQPASGQHLSSGFSPRATSGHPGKQHCQLFFFVTDALGPQTIRRHDTQHNDTQHNDTQHNDTQHNDTKHNDTQHNDTQLNDTQHNDTQHNDTQHNDTQHNESNVNEAQHKK